MLHDGKVLRKGEIIHNTVTFEDFIPQVIKKILKKQSHPMLRFQVSCVNVTFVLESVHHRRVFKDRTSLDEINNI